MKIVSIEKSPRSGKIKVSFDEREVLILSKEVLIDYGLRKNDDISDGLLLKIRKSQMYHDTYLAAMRLINYRMRTKSELVKRLREKKFPIEMIELVIGKLRDVGLIDDEKFAEMFVAGKVTRKPVGRRELERRLLEKGITKEAAAAALSTVGGEEIQNELALRAARTKIRALKRFDKKKRREKLISFLARRGFDWSIIKNVVRETFPERVSRVGSFDHSENGDLGADDI